jgi:hypothetical protein
MNYSQIFYIDPPDDLNKVREKLKETQKEKIILVLPEENKKLKSIENLTILKKEAQSLGKRLSIFSSDPKYKKLAEDCGIEIEGSLLEEGFSRGGELVFRPKISDILPPTSKSSAQNLPPKEIKEKKIEIERGTPEKETFPSKKKKWVSPLIYSLLFIILVGGVGFSWIYLPRAKITIIPAGEEIEFSGSFKAQKDANLNVEANIVPGAFIEKSQDIEKSFLATEIETREDKANGTITIYNEDSSSHRFVPGTRFKSEDGKIFKSQDWVNIPAGSKTKPGQVQIEVVAEKAGEEYNIGPTTFTIPGLQGMDLYGLIYAKSTEAMSGGFVGEAKVVGKEDLENAKKEMETLEENLASQMKDEILKEVSPNTQSLLEELIVVEKGEISFDKKAGEVGETFKGKATVTARLLNFNEDDVQEIIAKAIATKIKEGVEFEEVVSTQEIQYEILKNDIENGVMEVSFKGTEDVAWKVTADQIKEAVVGMDENSFQNYVGEQMGGKIKDGKVELWPFWVKKIPKREDRIFVEIKYE